MIMRTGYRLRIRTWCSLALISILLISGCTQPQSESPSDAAPTPSAGASDAYDFPIKPESEEWQAFKSHEEMLKACQIPKPLLKDISTLGLIETVMNYPLLSDIFLFDGPQIGIDHVSAQFNGLAELLKRKDTGSSLLNRYRAMDPAAIPSNGTEMQIGNYATGFFFVEAILAQESILSTLTASEARELIGEINAKAKAKLNYPEIYGASFWSSIWALDRAMLVSDYPPFKQKISENEMLKTFTRDGILHNVPSSVWDDILSQTMSLSEQYLTED